MTRCSFQCVCRNRTFLERTDGNRFYKERKIYLHEIKKIPQTFVLLQMSLWAEIVLFRDDYVMIEISDVDFLWQ